MFPIVLIWRVAGLSLFWGAAFTGAAERAGDGWGCVGCASAQRIGRVGATAQRPFEGARSADRVPTVHAPHAHFPGGHAKAGALDQRAPPGARSPQR